jgi:hypothetical protein
MRRRNENNDSGAGQMPLARTVSVAPPAAPITIASCSRLMYVSPGFRGNDEALWHLVA